MKDKRPVPKTTPIAKINTLGSERGTSSITLEINFWQRKRFFEVNKGDALFKRAIATELTVSAEKIKI
ncbi:MAG: hypothetical protein M1268_02895 [Patescibacteria group bacterium]|nr:hypothetical protein [Actinomycetota bacterium]MCL5438913.1 hypothetical protein [Patescibacteria group bacterium]